MSLSNPTNNLPSPCSRWYEWDGANGAVRYYDKTRGKKDAKGKPEGENVVIGDQFVFILLDELKVIKGWHDATESGITSNEIRDTLVEPFVVRAFKVKQGPLVTGIYSSIKDRVNSLGGYFMANLYIAYKNEEKKLVIGSIMFKGAALHAWSEFRNACRSELSKQAVQIKGSKAGKKGKVEFKTPEFFLKEISPETIAAATELDRELQKYLESYFSRKRIEQPPVNTPTGNDAQPDVNYDHEAPPPDDMAAAAQPPPESDDVPF